MQSAQKTLPDDTKTDKDKDNGNETQPPIPVSPREAVAQAKRSIEKRAEQLWGEPPPAMPAGTNKPEDQQPTEDHHTEVGGNPGPDASADPSTIEKQPTAPQPIAQPVNPVYQPLDPPAPDPEQPPQEAIDLAERCSQTCDAASGICESRAAICEIADDRPLDETFQVDCAWADQICSRAQDTCAECQAAH